LNPWESTQVAEAVLAAILIVGLVVFVILGWRESQRKVDAAIAASRARLSIKASVPVVSSSKIPTLN